MPFAGKSFGKEAVADLRKAIDLDPDEKDPGANRHKHRKNKPKNKKESKENKVMGDAGQLPATGSNLTRDQQIDQQQKRADADFASQIKMNDLQRQVNSNNRPLS